MGTHPIFESDFDCLTEMGQNSSKKSEKSSGYPTQGNSGYPQQTKPEQQNFAPPQNQAPPPYPGPGYPQPTQSQYAPPTQPQYAPPPQPQYPSAHGQPSYPPVPPGYAQQPYGAPPNQFQGPQGVQYQVAPNQFQPGQTVIVPNGFDSSARFHNGTASIPPPPPGHMPNAAQVAASQGANVQIGQKKESFVTGGKGGGYTMW